MVDLGQVIVYTYRVANVGNVELTDVTADDDKLGPVALGVTKLAPGEETGGVLTYTVVAADLPGPLMNTVTGTPPSGPAVTATAVASVGLRETYTFVYLPVVLRR